jgi:hypothetical protein
MLLTRRTCALLSAETERRIYRGRWRGPQAAVHLLRTRRPTPEEYDSWARASAPETGSLVTAEVKRRVITGQQYAPCVAVRLLRTRRPTPKEYDPCAWAPVPEIGSPWRASAEVFYGASGRRWGNPLKRDSPSVVAILTSALSPLSSLRSYVVVAAMALLDPPERLQPEVALNFVCNPLGWGVLAFAGRIRVGVSPHGDLAAGEFVFFVSKLPSGLGLLNPSFFVLLPEGLDLQPLHVTPCFILQAAIIAYLRGMSVEVTLLPASSSSIGGGEDVHQPCEGGQRAEPRLHPSRPNSLGWEASRVAAPSLWL